MAFEQGDSFRRFVRREAEQWRGILAGFVDAEGKDAVVVTARARVSLMAGTRSSFGVPETSVQNLDRQFFRVLRRVNTRDSRAVGQADTFVGVVCRRRQGFVAGGVKLGGLNRSRR